MPRPATPAAGPTPTPGSQDAQEPVGLGNRRLQIDRSGPFFTVFLTDSGAMGMQIRQKLSSLGPIFACQTPQVRQAPGH